MPPPPRHGEERFVGKVEALIHDRFGDFEGFTVETMAPGYRIDGCALGLVSENWRDERGRIDHASWCWSKRPHGPSSVDPFPGVTPEQAAEVLRQQPIQSG